MTTLNIDRLRDLFDERGRRLLPAAAAILLLVGGAAGTWWWMSTRWTPPPSIFDHPVDDALGYLALPDFNKLPLQERMRFLVELADRFRGLQPGESATAAAFLAGVVGPAREQLTQNARLLAKDILAEGAATYMDLPDSEKGKYIDEWVVKWMKTGERLATGKEGKATDEERLADIREDMGKERDRAARRMSGEGGGGGRPKPELNDRSAGRFMDFWQGEVEKASTPKEQGQIVRFMDDIRKHFSR